MQQLMLLLNEKLHHLFEERNRLLAERSETERRIDVNWQSALQISDLIRRMAAYLEDAEHVL